jgi:predicted dehydrogenase
MNFREQNVSSSEKAPARLGFVGLGWIGLNRLKHAAERFPGSIHAFVELDEKNAQSVVTIAPKALRKHSFDELLDESITGLVIATPNSLHAEQAVKALERGIAVFCQKPLGRNAYEARHVVEAARTNDTLLAVDHSYRWLSSAGCLRDLVQSGSLGKIFSIDLVFHNAYGPEKQWFFDRSLSGGGCLIDLGIHLLDLLFWIMGQSDIANIGVSLFSDGLAGDPSNVEDHAVVDLKFNNGCTVSLRCSWESNIGCGADIRVAFHGTKATGVVHNVGGSFFDFVAEKLTGTSREVIDTSDRGWNWGAGAINNWVERLQQGAGYDAENEQFIATAEVIDKIYDRFEGGIWQKQNEQQIITRSENGLKSAAAIRLG